ncbi:hypothetical protein [Saccharopolyspora phatthalungensis]|uniref:Secreted protein n=1 Tax=Saccharopolyspora phatthalungensis TaxID=664693 RepID=A0A840QFT2_9PSEU|nr:hypothetical protein [Saccharopolyspora phatthalungensis]MBB5158800.1 hypothetical protein [Saccharopolyspora phatthalungensis]
MRRVGSALIAGCVAVLAIVATAIPAAAATGEVVVFENEFTKLTRYQNPDGCKKLPAAAHVLNNETDQPVKIYGDPFCLGPSLTVPPGMGSHVAAGSGSFSA